jgi:uncharacterized membrane protein
MAFPSTLHRFYRLKSGIEQLLIMSSCFSVLLLLARILYSGELTFIFLPWNLFLAFVPYVISSQLQKNQKWLKQWIVCSIIVVLWVLFIPNSFYIITDLFHLRWAYAAPVWFDLLLIMSFAWNGLLLGVLSVRQMEKMVNGRGALKSDWLFLLPVMGLNAFGIYIGRFLRFNSWDVITNPFALMGDIVTIIGHPVLYKNVWGMVLCYTIFMSLVYKMIKKAGEAI